jgi:glutaredoxin-related protein
MSEVNRFLEKMNDDDIFDLLKEIRDSDKSLSIPLNSKIRKLVNEYSKDNTFPMALMECQMAICKEIAYRALERKELDEVDEKFGNLDIKEYEG